MGRLSKFKFPIPGRKQRQNAELPPQPELHAQNMKAHKLLGTTALNVDTSTQWDAASNSGISIAVSESTASHHPSERRARADTGAKARSQWGDESDTIPSHVQVPPVPSGYNTMHDNQHEHSDAPDLRKRQSNSTIMSYYDKSRVPLSVSQQTSASAMAKGLPTKASSILDIDGSKSQPHPARKTKPPKLDTGVFSRPPTNASNKSDHAVYSPSSTHHPLSPMSSRATLSSVKTERDRKSTMERLHEFTGRRRNPTPGQAPAPVPERLIRGAYVSHDTGLNHLYDHYEQMSFKQVMGEQDDISEGVEDEAEDEQPMKEPEIQEPHAYNHQHNKPAPPSRGTQDPGYATSISSRYTRTSKASKKTSPSFMDSDLHQRSVLSLSSDSEDDGYVEQPKPSPRPPRSRGAIPENEPIPIPERRQSVASAHSGVSGKSGASGRSGLRASFTSRNAFLAIPTEPLPPCPPEISRRNSSLGRRASTATASSQVSGISTSTAGSASQHLQDARLKTRAPASQFDRRSKASAQSWRASGKSEQTEPPLSPSSVEFFMTPPEGQDPRFIAVSRQEEMLLSALRMKRARMRGGGTLSELEEEGHMEALPEGEAAGGNPRDSARGLQKKASKSSVSTARTEIPRTESRASRQGAPRSASASATTRRATPPASTTSEPAAPKKQRSLRHQPSRETPPKGMMLDLDEEPSPDLSDFLEPDNGSVETDALSSRGRAGPKTPVTPSDVTHEPLLGQQGKRGIEGLRVVTEEGPDIPRPDSPISPKFSLFPMPAGRKGVRLSAVGGVAGVEAPWWGDDD